MKRGSLTLAAAWVIAGVAAAFSASAQEAAPAEAGAAQAEPAPVESFDPAIANAQAQSAALSAAAVPGATEDPLVSRVADYALFQRDLEILSERELADPADLDAAMDTLAAYDSRTLSDSWLSYAAFVAAQQPAFVDHVLEVADYYGRAQTVQGLLNEPNYVLTFPGAGEAARLVLDIMREDVATFGEVGDRFKQESYDLQTRGWSGMIARDREDRLETIQTPERVSRPNEELLASVAYGAPIPSTEPTDIAELRRTAFWSAVDYRSRPANAPGPRLTDGEGGEAIGVVMTLAALRVLEVSRERPDLVSYLLELPTAKACLDFASLHLRQCVAAAHFKYEDAFCIAEHQLLDLNKCFGESIAMRTPVIATEQRAATATTAAATAAAATTAAGGQP